MDPEVSEAVRAFYDFSFEGDYWHCLSYCFVGGAPQGLHLASMDLGSDSISWYHCDAFRLVLDSGDCRDGVTGCFVDKPVVCKCKRPA